MVEEPMDTSSVQADVIYDAGQTGCGELIMSLHILFNDVAEHQIVKVISNDLGAKEDIPSWCRMRRHTLLEIVEHKNECHYFIRKNN